MVDFLENMASEINRLFPEMEGRCLAVSEVEITKENMPTLPLVMVALVRETSENSGVNTNTQIIINEEFCVDFILKPIKLKRMDGSDSPYWAYYSYTSIRDRLLSNVLSKTFDNRTIKYRHMNVESDNFSVTLSFRLIASHRWCPDPEYDPSDGKPAIVLGRVIPPAIDCCDPGCPEVPCEDRLC